MKYLNETGLAHLWASLKTLLQGKQDKLTAGSGIDITDNVISATGGGGASYTAGRSIDIDQNNVINVTQKSLVPMMFWTNASPSWNPYVKSASGMSWDDFKNELKKGTIISTANCNNDFLNGYSYSITASSFGLSDSSFYIARLNGTAYNNLSSGGEEYIRAGKIYYFDGIVLYSWTSGARFAEWITVGNNNNSAFKLGEWLRALDTRIPTAPSTDGNYTLNCDISSGTASYSWDTPSGGTTYTAGANISINNGEISATDTTYTAGTNISINNGVISATDTTYTAGTGINISNGEISSTIQGIPTAPANDGTYMLKCVVSSGTPTYSWESITIGGSY